MDALQGRDWTSLQDLGVILNKPWRALIDEIARLERSDKVQTRKFEQRRKRVAGVTVKKGVSRRGSCTQVKLRPNFKEFETVMNSMIRSQLKLKLDGIDG